MVTKKTKTKRQNLFLCLTWLLLVFSPGLTAHPDRPTPWHSPSRNKANDKNKVEQFCRHHRIFNMNYFENLTENEIYDENRVIYVPAAYFNRQGRLVKLHFSMTPLRKVELKGFPKLKTLILERGDVRELHLSHLPGLNELNLWNNKNLGRVDLHKLKNLEKLYLSSCGITSLEDSRLPQSLIGLSLSGNPNLGKVDLTGFPNLKGVYLADCGITDLKELKLPGDLVALRLDNNKLPGTTDLSGFQKLEELSLVDCGIKDLKPLKLPPLLIQLDLGRNKNLSEVDVSRFKHLTNLYLYDCDIRYLGSSSLPPSIIALALDRNKNLGRVYLNRLKNLGSLSLSGCNITDLQLSRLPYSLSKLSLRKNRGLKAVDLSRFSNLKTLLLDGCGISDLNLSKIPRSLTELWLEGNRKLEKIDLSGLSRLKRLYLRGCGLKWVKLSDLPELNVVELFGNHDLIKADLKECPKIRDLRFLPDEMRHLREILLHPSNGYCPGIAKIKYGRDDKKRLASVEYFDETHRPVNHPRFGYAKRVIEYPPGYPKGRETKYRAEELKFQGPPDFISFDPFLMSDVFGKFQVIGSGRNFLTTAIVLPGRLSPEYKLYGLVLDKNREPVRKISGYTYDPQLEGKNHIWFYFFLYAPGVWKNTLPFDPVPGRHASRYIKFIVKEGDSIVMEKIVEWYKDWGYLKSVIIADLPAPPNRVTGHLILKDYTFLAEGDFRQPAGEGPFIDGKIDGYGGRWTRFLPSSYIMMRVYRLDKPDYELILPSPPNRGWLELTAGKTHLMKEGTTPTKPYVQGWWDAKGFFHAQEVHH